MKFIILLSLLSISALGQNDSDPFDDDADAPESYVSKWPSNIAPTPKALKALKEIDLNKEKKKKKTTHIRFIWVPTFDKPISIHVTKNPKGITLRYAQMTGSGGYE